MESKLINYSIFIEKRPDMEIHTEVAIVSCINSAYVLLDGECASLISQVDKFNMVDDRSQLDTNHELYRTDFELGQLQEALVFQVQYVLNMGNDFTVGGGSYSIGNINSSYSRPEGRELIAPGVYKLLSNARVYHLNAFGSFSNQNTNEIPLSTSKEIMERVKNEYVAQNQPNAQVGNVAYINQSHQVSFGSPQDLQITTYNTNRIAGPEGYRNNFYEIDSVPNIAFFGPDYNGTYSAVHRQEMIDYVNQNAGESLGQEIAQIKEEQEEQNNRLTQLEQETEDNFNEIANIKTKDQQQDNSIQTNTTNIQTNTNEISAIKTKDSELENRIFQHENEIVRLDGWSRALDTTVQAVEQKVQTNTNNITALDGRLVSVSGLLNQTIDGLRTLRPFKFVGLYDSSRTYMINEMVSKDDKFYLSLEDNNTTTPPGDKWLIMKEFQQVDLSDYPTKLEVNAIKTDLQNKITANTTNITDLTNRTNTIEQNYVSKTTTTAQSIASPITFTATDMVFKFNSGTNNSAYLAGFKSNNQRIWYFGKGSSTSDNFIIGADRGVIKLEPSTHVDVSSKRIINVATPTAINDAANKQYVDNLDNQNVKLAGDQRIEGTKTFTNASILLGELINIGQTQSSLVNKKYVDDAIANAAGTGGVGLENRIQVLENKVDATYGEFIDLANITIPNINQTNQIQQNAIDSNNRNIQLNRQHIADLQNNTVNTNTDQTINGIKTFTNQIKANGGITNLPLPTNNNEAANKQYVDNRISNIPVYNEYNLIYTNDSTWNNLQTITINISGNDTISKKSWMINFARMGNNGNKHEGDINYNFLLPELNNATFAGNSFWYNSTNKRFETGTNAGITILRTGATTLQLTIQCWDNSNRIKFIRLYAPK